MSADTEYNSSGTSNLMYHSASGAQIAYSRQISVLKPDRVLQWGALPKINMTGRRCVRSSCVVRRPRWETWLADAAWRGLRQPESWASLGFCHSCCRSRWRHLLAYRESYRKCIGNAASLKPSRFPITNGWSVPVAELFALAEPKKCLKITDSFLLLLPTRPKQTFQNCKAISHSNGLLLLTASYQWGYSLWEHSLSCGTAPL